MSFAPFNRMLVVPVRAWFGSRCVGSLIRFNLFLSRDAHIIPWSDFMKGLVSVQPEATVTW